MCHLILLMPFIGLSAFWVWPSSIALPVYLVILIPSVWLYWYVVRSAHWPVQTGIEHMRSARGMVVAVNGSRLTVFIDGENWNAVSKDRLTLHEEVEVYDVQGLELKVRRKGATI